MSKPIKEIKLGRISLAIWGKDNITVSRFYKDKKDGKWKFCNHFRPHDMDTILKCIDGYYKSKGEINEKINKLQRNNNIR